MGADDHVETTVLAIIQGAITRESRPPNTLICSQKSLSKHELSKLVSLFHLERTVLYGAKRPAVTKAAWKRFMEEVFLDWNSAHRVNHDREIRPRTFSDSNVEVGFLSCDHPPPKEDPEWVAPRWRRRDSKVFLGLTTKTHGDEIEFIWKDIKGGFVSSSIVTVTVPGGVGAARLMATENYDKCLQRDYKEHNHLCIINEARRRIKHFAEHGTIIFAALGREHRNPIIKEPELALPKAKELCQSYVKFLELMDKADAGESGAGESDDRESTESLQG
ncbi:hypothetical protein FPOAC2_09056 [Fusarium poae]|uniref:hypothetical protein n=1 Tax=Fusarium poae TaxID=36050 RepID=UPI001CEBD37F|nr:hypothetical protein FPOAC1_009114 [Fusarium poae]KAG8669715.1 hypothetical protein FPOAC1_009114 [Fusarium poae]